jgi:hypothetical protein
MRLLALAIAMTTMTAAHADAAPDARILRTLKRLGPTDRIEQLCDYTAMLHIRKDARRYHPDRAVAGAVSEPKLGPNSIDAKGAAFRSRGHWYEMAYSCATTPDHLQVLKFSLSIGKEIPQSSWATYGLWQ